MVDTHSQMPLRRLASVMPVQILRTSCSGHHQRWRFPWRVAGFIPAFLPSLLGSRYRGCSVLFDADFTRPCFQTRRKASSRCSASGPLDIKNSLPEQYIDQ